MSPKFIFKVFDCLVRPPILKHVATIGKRARQSILLILLRHYFIPRFYKLIIFLFCSGEVSLSTSGDRSHLQGKMAHLIFLGKSLDSLESFFGSLLILQKLNKIPPSHQPYLSAGETAGLSGWKDDLAKAAQFPGVFCKLSGLVTEVDPVNHREHFTAKTFRQAGWNILSSVVVV